MLPKPRAYVKSYDGKTKQICFLIDDDKNLQEMFDTIWDKVRTNIKKEFDSEPIYNKMFWKTKIKSYRDFLLITDTEATDFHSKEIPKGQVLIVLVQQ